jgi:hypothetical protein
MVQKMKKGFFLIKLDTGLTRRGSWDIMIRIGLQSVYEELREKQLSPEGSLDYIE